jgi:hypothetical protein
MEVIMKKTHSFLLTAGIALATTFTLSCSDDKEEGNGGYLSCSEAWGIVTTCSSQHGKEGAAFDGCLESKGICGSNALDEVCKSHYDSCPEFGGNNTPGVGGGIPQDLLNLPVSFDGILNSAKIDLFMTFPHYRDISCGGYDGYECECTGYDGVVSQCEYDAYSKYDSIPAGKIENGLLILELPTQAQISKYLGVVRDRYYMVTRSSLRPAIPGKSDCFIVARLINSGKGNKTGIVFWYSSDAVRPSPNEHEDLNFLKGWNIVYAYYLEGVDENGRYFAIDYMNTTDRSKVDGGTFEWQLEECRDEGS